MIANVDCSTDTFLVILQCNHEVIPLSPASACAPGDGDNDDVSVTCCELRTICLWAYDNMSICQ